MPYPGERGILQNIFGRHSRERGFPLGACESVANDIETQLGYPTVRGHLRIGDSDYRHSWNQDGADIIEGGTAHQFNGFLRLLGLIGFKPGPQRIRPEDQHYSLYRTGSRRPS